MNDIINDQIFFSGTKPNLINKKALKSINKIFVTTKNKKKSITSSLIYFYNEYIKVNLFGILVFIIITLFLFIKYITKKHNDKFYKKIKNKKNTELNDTLKNDNFTIDSICSSELSNLSDNTNASFYTELNEEYNKIVKDNVSNMSKEIIKKYV